MNDLSVRLVNDASGFNSSMEEATRHVQDFAKETDKASDEVKKFGADSAKSAKDLIKEMSAISGAERNLHNYKRQLSQITKDIQDLTINYRSMSAEMKNSELGQEALAKIQELTLKAGEYKDAIMDAQAAIKAVASDTAAWDAAKQGIDALSGALQGVAAMGVLGKKSTEDLVKVIAKLKAIEAATNAVIKVGNALQRNSALMMGIAKVQALALAAAKNAEAVATGKATIAQKIFNAVAKANPYVLLATAIIAVGTALVAFTRKSKEAEAAEKAHQEALEKEEEKFNDYKDTVSSTVGNVVGKFMSLTVSYRNLSSEMQKKKWIQENKSAFEDLGLKVSDVNSADEIFIRQTDLVIAALKARAKATALQSMYEKEYQKEIAARIQADKLWENRQRANTNKIMTTGGDMFGNNGLPKEWNAAGANTINVDYTYEWGGGQSGAGWIQLTPEGERKLNEYFDGLARAAGDNIVSAATSDIATLERLWDEAEREAISAEHAVASLVTPGGRRSGGGSNTKPEEPLTPGSLAEAQRKVQELQTKLNNMAPNDAAFEETKRQLEEARAEVERIQKLVNPAVAPEIFPEGSLKEANHFVQLFSQQLQDLDPNSDEFKEILELLNLWKQKQKEINDLINGTSTAVETVVDKYDKIVRSRNDIQKKFEIGAISFDEAQTQIADLNKQLSDLGLTATVKLDIDKESIKSTADKMKDFVSTMDKVGSMSNAVTAINSVYESIKSLNDVMNDEEKDGWEKFFAIFQTGMTIFEAVASVIEVVATVTELLSAAKAANAAASTTEAAAAGADATAQAADAAATTTNAAAHGAAAAAEAGQSVASIPYVGPVLAIAAIAAVMAAIIGILASAKGFAEGGIVGGHSYTGDKILARLNSNEMVLTTEQQERLWAMMNAPENYNSSRVEFEISGTNLRGVLNNVNKKLSKV